MRFLIQFMVALVISTGAVAQTDMAGMMAGWMATASRAEDILETKLASTPAMETLRNTLLEQRSQTLELETLSREKLKPFQDQLAALGPAPEEGALEAVELAGRRSELNGSITAASVPLRIAQASYRRADGLIAEINAIIRTRFSDELRELGPSPLSPTLWPAALKDLSNYAKRVSGEITEAFALESSRRALRKKAPLALLIAVIGIWMLLGIQRGFAEMVRRTLAFGGEAKHWQYVLANFVRLIVPATGAAAVIFALQSSDLVGVWGQAVLSIAPHAAFALIVAPWLGRSIFRPESDEKGMLGTPGAAKLHGYRISIALGLIYAISVALDAIADRGSFSLETQAVIQFPLLVVAAIMLFRFSRIMRGKHEPVVENEEEQESSIAAFTSFLARLVFLVAISAPILAAIGYFAAALYLIFPTIITLSFLAGLLVLFDLVRAVLAHWIEGDGKETRHDNARLIPVFIGFLLILAALPVLALIWGARPSDLWEIWGWLNDGIAIGEGRFSLSDLLVFVLVFGFGYTITRLVQKTVRKSVLPKTKMDIGGRTAILAGIGYSGIFLAALAAISATGLDLSSLAIVAGALSVGIGFGLQTIVSNFVSGIILLVERPIKEGDWISAGGFEGIVRKISIRATLVDTFDRCAVIIPNSDLIAGSVTNWTAPDQTGRLKVQIGVAYGSDPEQVKEILLSIAEAHPGALKYPAPSVIFRNFGASALDFEIRVFLRDVNKMLSVKSDINFAIARRFAEENIEIPFDQSEVTLKNIDQIGAALSAAILSTKDGKI